MARDWREAGLDPADAALCRMAEKLTRRSADMTPDDLEALRGAGFDDTAIHDAVQVVAYFNYITRVAHALGVEPESFVARWGER